MLNYLLTDIECVANEKAKEHFAKKTYEAPSNWKDPEKIEAHIIEARHKDVQKAALSWWTGKIVCIGTRSLDGTVKTFVGPDEASIITAFFTYLSTLQSPILIGKNSETFDKPYIIGRALALSIGLPQQFRPYRPIEDLDQIFGWSSASTQRGSLADYAFGLGIDGKSAKGTDVQTWYDAATIGNEDKGWKLIASYCNQDNVIASTLLERYLKVFTPTKKEDKATAPETSNAPNVVAIKQEAKPAADQVVDGVQIPFPPPKDLGGKPKNKGGRPRKNPKPEEKAPPAKATIVPPEVVTMRPPEPAQEDAKPQQQSEATMSAAPSLIMPMEFE